MIKMIYYVYITNHITWWILYVSIFDNKWNGRLDTVYPSNPNVTDDDLGGTADFWNPKMIVADNGKWTAADKDRTTESNPCCFLYGKPRNFLTDSSISKAGCNLKYKFHLLHNMHEILNYSYIDFFPVILKNHM